MNLKTSVIHRKGAKVQSSQRKQNLMKLCPLTQKVNDKIC